MTVDKIRVSIGSASVLGLYDTARFKIPPLTCYIMTYHSGSCIANCGFCPQARNANGANNLLSRVSWPIFPFKDFLTKLSYQVPSKRFQRICIQTLNYPNNVSDLIEIIRRIKEKTDIPISVATPPLKKEILLQIKNLGIDRIGIALDASTPELFDQIKGKEVKGPYTWTSHIKALKDSLDIFSDYNVTTHIIVGLGETSRDIIDLIVKMDKLKIKVSLFAFTPIKGTKLELRNPPELLRYRKIQLAKHLLIEQKKNLKDIVFNQAGEIIRFNINRLELSRIVNETKAFLTPGCPGCNRPYYTSRPTGPIYNYPRELNEEEKHEIIYSLQDYVI